MVAKQAKPLQGKFPGRPDAIAGRAISSGVELGIVTIEIEDGRIGELHEGAQEGAWMIPEGWTLAPGLIDLQVNGLAGIHLASDPDQLGEVVRLLPRAGVTAFLPTLPSPSKEEMLGLDESLERLTQATGLPPGAEPLGIHLEGPAISPARAGAHPQERICPPSEVIGLLDSKYARLLTLAPEVAGSDDLIDCATSRNVVLAAGHSDGTYEDGVAAIDSGVRILTHTFNAMRPLGHRDPGLVGAYLEDKRTTICVIADGIHVAPPVASLLWRLKGPKNLALVSDAIALTPAGIPQAANADSSEGRYAPALPLMGGVCTLGEGLAGLAGYGCAPIAGLYAAASSTPANALGLDDRSSLETGKIADLVAIDSAGLPRATWCYGRLAWPLAG